MAYEELLYTVENKNIALITLNRPDAMNALTLKTHDELSQALEEADQDERIRVIVITGAGRGFCSGDDVKLIFKAGEGYDEKGEERIKKRQLTALEMGKLRSGGGAKLLETNKPSIAAVNGAAVGYGCDLTLMCDMRIASEHARFGEVFLRVGLIPDEGLILLPRLVGLAKAYELIMTTDIINAEEAEHIGLVNRVVPHDQLMTSTMDLAAKIANKPPISVKLAKEGIRRGLTLPIEAFRQWHAFAFSYVQQSEDHREGARAFVEKREPEFKGR